MAWRGCNPARRRCPGASWRRSSAKFPQAGGFGRGSRFRWRGRVAWATRSPPALGVQHQVERAGTAGVEPDLRLALGAAQGGFAQPAAHRLRPGAEELRGGGRSRPGGGSGGEVGGKRALRRQRGQAGAAARYGGLERGRLPLPRRGAGGGQQGQQQSEAGRHGALGLRGRRRTGPVPMAGGPRRRPVRVAAEGWKVRPRLAPAGRWRAPARWRSRRSASPCGRRAARPPPPRASGNGRRR